MPEERIGWFGGTLLAVGLVALLLPIVLRTVNGWNSRSWQAVPGAVLATGLDSTDNSDDGGHDYRPAVRYAYQWSGCGYQGHTIAFEPRVTSRRTEALAWLQELSAERAPFCPGAALTVYVNPANPSQSVLRPGMTRANWSSIAGGLLFLAVGVGYALHGLRRLGRATARRRQVASREATP